MAFNQFYEDINSDCMESRSSYDHSVNQQTQLEQSQDTHIMSGAGAIIQPPSGPFYPATSGPTKCASPQVSRAIYFAQSHSPNPNSPRRRQKFSSGSSSSDDEDVLEIPEGVACRLSGSDLLPEAKEILHDLEKGSYSSVYDILMIGRPDSGKAALINSLAMSPGQMKYQEISRLSNTKRKVKCHDPLKLIKKYDRLRHFRTNICIWKCPGLPEDLEENTLSTLLQLLINGSIPENTKIDELASMTSSQLLKKYVLQHDSRLMDLLVFVYAATDSVPENLTKAARTASQSQGVPMIAVVTKNDLVLTKLESIQRAALTTELGLTQDSVAVVGQYCPSVTPGMQRCPGIDADMCHLWKLILSTVYS